MQRVSKRRGTLALTASIILIMSAAAGGVYLYSSNFFNDEAPQVQVASVSDGEVLPAGAIEIKGAAADDGAVKAVSIRVDGGSPIPVVPIEGDYSSWSVVLDLDPGNHTIEIETVDDSGRRNSKEISVVAANAMEMPADMVVEASGSDGAVVDYKLPVVQEGINISSGPDCLPASGSMFPMGITSVECSVTIAGGTATSDFKVSVVDTISPTIIAPPDVTVENLGVAFMELSLSQPIVDDNIDADPTVTNNAPANGFALGITTVVWTAEDDHGNVATAEQKVTVTAIKREIVEEKDYDPVIYSGRGGGGGGSSSNSGQDDDDVNENNGSEGESAPLQHILTIKAEDLSGESISVSMTIKATNGTSLQTGSTPLTFSGTNLTYDITAADYDDARFDHWENGAASLTRQLTLSQDTTIVAYYNTSDTKSDTTAPTVTATPAGGTFTSVQSVTLTASEPAAIYYTISGNTPTTSSTVYSSPITITSMTTLKYFAKDAAGNSGSVATQTYTINAGDTTDPSVEITNFDDGSTIAMPAGGLITVHGTASDNQGGSGIEVVEVRVDDGNYVVATPTIQGDWSSWSVTLEVTAGERRLVPRATDNAGNQAWGSIYVTFTEPSGGGDNGGGDNGSLDDFGIEKLYPTVNGGNEWYVNMDDPYSDPLLQNRETLTEQPDGSWQVSGGSNGQVRLEAWSPANEKWLNVEITMYAKMVSGSNELLQMYSRGGHHTSSNECLGSAYKARFYGDGDAAWVKEVNHPAYAGNRGSVQATNTPLADRWIGLKAVIYNFVENGKTYVRLESYIDDDVTDSSGNLVVGNNWELASVVEDRGGWASNDSDFNPTCAPVNKDSTQQYRQRDEIINMSGGTSTQNIAAFRSDNLTWNWKYLSVREIAPPS